MQLRSIPKARSRLMASSMEGRERAEYLKFREIYKEKKTEFVKIISNEAQNLQQISDQKTAVLGEISKMVGRKSILARIMEILGGKIQDAYTELDQMSDKVLAIDQAKDQIRRQEDKLKQKQIEVKREAISLRDTMIFEAKEEIKKAEQKKESGEQSIKRLEEEKTSLFASNQRLQDDLAKSVLKWKKESETRENQGKIHLKKIESDLTKLSSQKASLENKVQELVKTASKVVHLTSLDSDIKKAEADAQSRYVELKSQIEGLEVKVKSLNEQKEKIQFELSDRRSYFAVQRQKTEEDIELAKERQKTEIQKLEEKKSNLTLVSDLLQEQISQAKTALLEESDRQYGMVSTVTKELVKEKQKLEENKKESEKLQEVINELQTAANELKEFIPKGQEAQEKFKELQEKIVIAEKRYQTILKDTNKKMSALDTKNTEMDAYHEYMKDLSGRLTTSLRVVREATEELNEMLKENNAPFRFQLPPNQIKEIKLYAP